MKTKLILTSLLVVSVAAVFPVIPNSVLAQGELTSKSVILYPNDDYGMSANLGWDPNGNYNTFRIIDLSVTPTESTVLVNVVQDTEEYGTLLCSVDQLVWGGFEVACDYPPNLDAVLHYTIFNNEKVESTGAVSVASLADQIPTDQNLTTTFSAGGLISNSSAVNSTAAD